MTVEIVDVLLVVCLSSLCRVKPVLIGIGLPELIIQLRCYELPCCEELCDFGWPETNLFQALTQSLLKASALPRLHRDLEERNDKR